MKIYVSVKQAGKRKEYITHKELVLDMVPTNLRELIKEIVYINVKEFNISVSAPNIIRYICDIDEKIRNGKVSFGQQWNTKQADYKKSFETAILAYEDGIFRVFINDTEIEYLDEKIVLNENDVITFIRFTMLVGRMW